MTPSQNILLAPALVVQLIGPLFVKPGVRRAGEIGLNVREEDLILSYCVTDVMDKTVPIIHVGTPLREIIRTVSGTASSYYPVVDSENRLAGAITLYGIRNTFAPQELND